MYFDDDADSCEMMKVLLSSSIPGLIVEPVMSGSEAVRLASEYPFDVYILDAKVPDISGFDVCRTIRLTDPNVPIYFYTGLASKEDRHQAFEAGCTDVLVKPNDMDTLIKLISDQVRKADDQPMTSAPAG
jgi:Response regulators consisting of a CheY-like receiver domain and a winged-helix DNA-binding domain